MIHLHYIYPELCNYCLAAVDLLYDEQSETHETTTDSPAASQLPACQIYINRIQITSHLGPAHWS